MENAKIIITQRDEAPTNSVLPTPRGKSDIEIVQMQWYSRVLVRVARVYIQSLIGILIAVSTGAAHKVGIDVPAYDFFTLLVSAGSIAVAPAFMSLLQNSLELLAKLDVTSPEMRA